MTPSWCVAVRIPSITSPHFPTTATAHFIAHPNDTMIPVSDHPLTHILRENTPKPAIGILESAISQALLTGHRFGILSTGSGYKYIRSQDVYSFMGGNSTRYAGLVTTGLGVVELREGERAKVEKGMRDGSAKLAGMGADVILLGCAGECLETTPG